MELGFIPVPPKSAAILAAEELAKGKTLTEICATVGEAAKANPEMATEPALQIAPAQAAPAPTPALDVDKELEMRAHYYRMFLLAYLRLCTGKIEGLPLDEMEDVALLATVPALSFETWLGKKGLAADGGN